MTPTIAKNSVVLNAFFVSSRSRLASLDGICMRRRSALSVTAMVVPPS
jgi:hypothetical protein